jgi:hypothetical protein
MFIYFINLFFSRKHTYNLCMNTVYMLTVTNMAVIQNFEVISGKFNVVRK